MFKRHATDNWSLIAAVGVWFMLPTLAAGEDYDRLLQQANDALRRRANQDAKALADQAIALESKRPAAFVVRGQAYAAAHQHAAAVKDFTAALERDPKLAFAYHHRGVEHFLLEEFNESVADFDRFLALEPEQRAGHWQRGIACYYAGKFDEGRKQFEAYTRVDPNDVENSVWQFLCAARFVGVDKARAAMIKAGQDRRIPLMEIQACFAGSAQPDAVMAAARAGQPSPAELRQRLFYAHLYLGLYADALGDQKQALVHLEQAVQEAPADHYMGEVARVHRAVLLKQAKSTTPGKKEPTPFR